MLPHARVLLHQGSAGIGGTAMDIAIQADDLRHTRDTVLRLIAEDTGQDVETVERDSRRDRWFSAEEALAYGFVDHVVASLEEVQPAVRRPLGLGALPVSSYPIPYVTTLTNRGERTVDVYSRLLADRVIYLGTPIDDGVANTVIAQLIHLESESPEAPINLYLNSPGRLDPGDAGDLRRDAVRPARRRDHVRRAGRRHRGRAPGRRRARVTARSCGTAGWCCTLRPPRVAAPSPT